MLTFGMTSRKYLLGMTVTSKGRLWSCEVKWGHFYWDVVYGFHSEVRRIA